MYIPLVDISLLSHTCTHIVMHTHKHTHTHTHTHTVMHTHSLSCTHTHTHTHTHTTVWPVDGCTFLHQPTSCSPLHDHWTRLFHRGITRWRNRPLLEPHSGEMQCATVHM